MTAIRRKGDQAAGTSVSAEAVEFLPGLDVPKSNRLVVAGGKGAVAVGRDSDAIDVTRVAGETADSFAARQLPERDLIV